MTAVVALTVAIQESIQENVVKMKPRLDAKRWWNGDLGRERKELNRLRSTLFRYCALADHPSHEELRLRSNQWGGDSSSQATTVVQLPRGNDGG